MKIDFDTDCITEKGLNFLKSIMVDKYYYIHKTCQECESPIEQIMFLAIEDRFKDDGNFYIIDFYISAQHPIKLNNKHYRVDLRVVVNGRSGPNLWPEIDKESQVELFIECDGHDFHEKTKEQAKYDKQRDRAFAHASLNLLRFTGSEIYNKPEKCADEVYEFICNKLDDNGRLASIRRA